MPELPEVQALGDFLAERASEQLVLGAHAAAIGALKTYAPPLDDVAGRVITGVTRRGKWLGLGLGPKGELDADAPELFFVFHLSKAGWLRWREDMPAMTSPKGRPMGRAAGPLAVRVWLADGSGFDLTEAGTKKRLAVYLVSNLDAVGQIATLGFEPLEAQAAGTLPEQLATALRSKNQQVKGALRDQSLIAGIGNAYSDEILHAAKLSPFALTGKLTDEEIGRIAAATSDVLTAAVSAAAGKPASQLKDAKRRGMAVHGRTGETCPACGDTVREVSFADRSLQYCATCQTDGKPLADRRMSRLLK